MSNEHPAPAVVKSAQGVSKIWLVPIVAVLIGAWMVYFQWANQGPFITIEFPNAEGIEPGKTKIKTRDVDIGLVKQIQIKEDLSGVIVTAQIDLQAANLVRENSQFWVVSPRVSLSGVSGLNTLLSGPYIAMSASAEGAKRYNFVALPQPPVTPDGTPGLHITLNSNDRFAFKEGDAIIYKGLKVGEFEDIYFNFEERVVYYNAFIRAPYHRLITKNTKFWNVSGVRFELGTKGISIETGSVESLLTNGVTFGVPPGVEPGAQITDREFFDIHASFEQAVAKRNNERTEFVVLVEETIRGLSVGAPVEYRGLVIGEVLAINIQDERSEGLMEEGYSIPVLISIEPGRVHQPDTKEGADFVRAQTLKWIGKGLRASLKIGNLLTGALFVELQHYPNVAAVETRTYGTYPVIPTISGEFAQITQKVSGLLDKLNALPLENTASQANALLLEVTATAATFKQTGEQLNTLLLELQEQQISGNLTETLEAMQTLMQDFSAGSANYEELNRALLETRQSLKTIQPLIKQLNQQPNRLIFGDGKLPYLTPKGKTSNEEPQQ